MRRDPMVMPDWIKKMTLFKNRYRIETTRLKGRDYSNSGFYYVTVCVKNREMLFGEIVNNKMILNEHGKIINHCWYDLINHYENMKPDTFVIMPNHIHGIVVIFDISKKNNDGDIEINIDTNDNVETGFKPVSTTFTTPLTPSSMPKTKKQYSLSEIIRGFKTFSARKINQLRNTSGVSVWQPRFYDRIIRDEQELFNVRNYINNNPIKWDEDKYNV